MADYNPNPLLIDAVLRALYGAEARAGNLDHCASKFWPVLALETNPAVQQKAMRFLCAPPQKVCDGLMQMIKQMRAVGVPWPEAALPHLLEKAVPFSWLDWMLNDGVPLHHRSLHAVIAEVPMRQDCLDRLLQAQCPLDGYYLGFTPLQMAVRAGRRELAQLLLDQGADPLLKSDGLVSLPDLCSYKQPQFRQWVEQVVNAHQLAADTLPAGHKVRQRRL